MREKENQASNPGRRITLPCRRVVLSGTCVSPIGALLALFFNASGPGIGHRNSWQGAGEMSGLDGFEPLFDFSRIEPQQVVEVAHRFN